MHLNEVFQTFYIIYRKKSLFSGHIARRFEFQYNESSSGLGIQAKYNALAHFQSLKIVTFYLFSVAENGDYLLVAGDNRIQFSDCYASAVALIFACWELFRDFIVC